MEEKKYAWTTLLTSQDYIQGILNLHFSLQRIHSKYPLIIIVSDTIAFDVIPTLEANHCLYYVVPDLNRMSEKYNFQIDMLMKFYSFELTEYEKVCYLDGDILILKNCDFIFNFRTPAAKFLGWDHRPVQSGLKKDEGMLAGEVMLLEPGTFSMDFFFSSTDIGDLWDEKILLTKWKIQTITDLPLSDKNYIYHSHAHGHDNKYWEKYYVHSREQLETFLDTYSITHIWSSTELNHNYKLINEEEPPNDNN